MRAGDVLRQMEERQENQLMILYRDEKGVMRSLVYQDLMFFEVTGHDSFKLLGNPFELLRVIERLKSGKYKFVGKGYYSQPVKIK